jgi:hypothetical protein
MGMAFGCSHADKVMYLDIQHGTTKQYFNMNSSWPDQLHQKSYWYGIQANIAPSVQLRGMATILK